MTAVSAGRRADALEHRDLAALQQAAHRPTKRLVDDVLLTCHLGEKSRLGLALLHTERSASPAVADIAAVSRSSLAGMHPTCRQVPPTLSFSIIAMCRPADAP